MRLRSVVFWVHLVAGLVAAPFVAIMSITGILIAFEQEILAFIDRDASRVIAPFDARPRSIDTLLDDVGERHPGLTLRSLVVHADPARAHRVAGRSGEDFYLDPFTGATTEPPSERAHEVLHFLEDLHRFLALEGDAEPIGKFIQGSANLAFVLLCLTGLYLWFPRNWARRALRPLFLLVPTRGPRAKQFNRHAVFGFWSLPVLVVIAGSAVAFSFAWAHQLVFALAGEQAPESRGFGMLAVDRAEVPAAENAPLLSLDTIRDRLASAYPEHESMVFFFQSPEKRDGEARASPLDVHVLTPDLFSTRGRAFVQVDPHRGDILSSVGFEERSLGLRARVWLRFLHTGEALGLTGKILASLATAASLVLVYSGVALAYRRFTRRRRRSRRGAIRG